MIDIDKWQEIFSTLQRHKLRTILTVFGVFWGIFMLVVLLGMSKGLENGILATFGNAQNTLLVFSGRPTSLAYEGLSTGRRVQFNEGDIEALRSQLTNIEWLFGRNYLGSQLVEYAGKRESYEVKGVAPQSLHLLSKQILQGRFIHSLDFTERRKVAVIGEGVAELLFALGSNVLGQSIRIHGIYFTVVGVYGDSDDSGGVDDIYIPNSTLRYVFGQRDHIGSLVITGKSGVRMDAVEREVKRILKKRHRVHPDDPAPISSFNVQNRYEKFQALFTGIASFGWVVAIGTIISGVIGVGNIMLIVVKERTREIGIRKALGATPASIVGMIVQESLVLTAVSGYFGLVVGVFSLQGVAFLLEKNSGGGGFFSSPEISFDTAVIAILVLVVAGALAALLPASKAAGIDPVRALQDE